MLFGLCHAIPSATPPLKNATKPRFTKPNVQKAMFPKLSFLLLLHLLHTTLSVTQPFKQRNPNRHFILSTVSPLTEILSSSSMREQVIALHELIQQLSQTIEQRISNNDTLACNLRAAPWLTSQVDDFQALQLGLLDRTCQSRIVFSDAIARNELPESFYDTARAVLRAGAESFRTAIKEFVNDTSLDWGDVHPIRGWDVLKMGQKCTVETAIAYRINSVWYVRAVATNHPVDAFVQDGERQYVQEFIPADFSRAFRVVHPAEDDGGLVNGTTLLIRQGGKAGVSSVAMGDAENPALDEALRLNELAVDQAQDAITPSNIAILALPMVMALIPVAFVAELNTFATIMYIVFTDIFSTLPFLIKGIELTTTGVINRGELVGYHLGTVELGVLEVWAAQCHGEDSFRDLGIAFIVTAMLLMILGICFEMFAWRHMRRKGRFAQGPFGKVFRVDPYTLMMRTVDEDDGEEIVEEERRRWRIRWKGLRRQQPADNVDDMD